MKFCSLWAFPTASKTIINAPQTKNQLFHDCPMGELSGTYETFSALIGNQETAAVPKFVSPLMLDAGWLKVDA